MRLNLAVGLLILTMSVFLVREAAAEKSARLVGTTPQGQVISEQGEVQVADDYNEANAAYVARFTGQYPRQDWREVLRTRPRLTWFKFYLTLDQKDFFWPKGQVVSIVFGDSASTHVEADELFVVSPDNSRAPTFLGRGTVAKDGAEFLHHDANTVIIYAGFPSGKMISVGHKTRLWEVADGRLLKVGPSGKISL